MSDRGAFFSGDTLTFTVEAPRALGAAAVVLRIAPDGCPDSDRPFSFVERKEGMDVYRLSLSLRELCWPEGHGLFYYELLFLRGKDTLFTDTAGDNVTFTLSPCSRRRFRLLVSQDDFVTPSWFHGKTMYHVFVDRFAPGGGERPEDAVYHDAWDEEIEQFGAFAGAPVKNNEFYGGTLWGVIDRLDYLASLGVGVIYLSPIFKSVSNHKYDTGDYECVDPQFGGDEALAALIAAARERGIGILLDGVFNHTGDDSRYFNRRGHYDTVGAYQSKESPYYSWFCFHEHPHVYESWWGIEILPKLNLNNPETHRYFVGHGGIVERYTKMGLAGWRLDVADELPNQFLVDLRRRVKASSGGEGLVLGEVWENAADKIAYGKRRHYFEGGQLDSVMNYPLRGGIISFVRDGDAEALSSVLRELWGSYPTTVCHSLMNILSTHDTERILTTLAGDPDDGTHTNAELREMRLRDDQRATGIARLKMASVLQYTVFGVPSLFYGDEAGLEGYHDPFCRRPFPWGRENGELLAHYRRLGRIRQEHSALCRGDFRLLQTGKSFLVFSREDEHECLVIAANNGTEPLALPFVWGCEELLTGESGVGEVLPGSAWIWRVR